MTKVLATASGLFRDRDFFVHDGTQLRRFRLSASVQMVFAAVLLSLVGWSSYAVARVAALAARLLREHPRWKAPELKKAILQRARPAPSEAQNVVKHGWIPDPTADE